MIMSELNNHEYAMLELLAMQPLSVIPTMYRPLISQLSTQGLTVQKDAQWYLTPTALRIMGRTSH